MLSAIGIGKRLMPGVTWRIPNGASVHLTFDDGPHPDITPWLLDQLDAHEVKATFFLIGHNAERYPGLVDEINGRGHTIGNHTYSHLNGWRTPLDEYIKDVARCQDHIPPLGVRGLLKLFRPPYGKMTWRQMRAIREQYQIIMWDVMPGDFNPRISPVRLQARIRSRARPGSIIVLHENEKAWGRLRVALPQILGWLQDSALRSNVNAHFLGGSSSAANLTAPLSRTTSPL